ncbi:MAG: helix-turn-helix domain-containing protein [Rubripirellula sp.]
MKSVATLNLLEMDDVDHLNQHLGDWSIDSLQLDEGRHRSRFEQIIFPQLSLNHFFEHRTRRDEFRIPPNTTSLCLFRSDAPPAHWCGYEIPSDSLLINHSGRDHFAILPAGHEGISILLSNDLIAELELVPTALIAEHDRLDRMVIPLAGPQGNVYRNWLFSQFESPRNLDSLASDPMTATLFYEQVLHGLADVVHRGLLAQGFDSRVRCLRRYSLVRNVMGAIDLQISDDLSTAQLAAEFNVSARVLQYAFRDVLGTSPYQYVLMRKLHAARRELRETPRFETNVSEVASRYGFDDFGRFSVRYRRVFGESPSETLRTKTITF